MALRGDRDQFVQFLSIAAIVAYFLILAHPGLHAWFSVDDVVNICFLHGYGHVSIPVLVVEALSVFTPEYRPVGGIYYRVLYAIFGLRATPFRLVFFLLLLVNMGLAGVWIRRVSNSKIAAFAGVTILSYHAALTALYYNDGTIYDVLCLFFILLALIRYTQVRQMTGAIGGIETFRIALLLGAALGSKEMAAMLPGFLIAYEFLLAPPNASVSARARPLAVLVVTAAACMMIKILVPNQMSSNDLYKPHLSIRFILANYLRYHQLLLFHDGMTWHQLALLLLCAVAVAFSLRNRSMLLGLIFAWLALLPVSVIDTRGGFVCYIPLVGYGLYIGGIISGIVRATDRIFRNSVISQWVPGFVCAGFLLASYTIQNRYSGVLVDSALITQEQRLKALLAVSRNKAASLPPGSRILLENDPFPALAWQTLFVLRLGYRNPTLWVERVSTLAPTDDSGLYALRLRWNGSTYSGRLEHGPLSPTVSIAITPRIVRRGKGLWISLPTGLGGCSVDVAYRMPDDELIRAGVWRDWVKLDQVGRGQTRLDQDIERGRVVIDRIRACDGDWIPAQGSFVIWP